MINYLLAIILLASVFYLSFGTTLFLGQSRLIYFPEKKMILTPRALGLTFDKVNFPAEDGTMLTGWFIPAEKRRGVVLFCHGNAGNISHRLQTIKVFHDLGFATFIFDYRGYGQSQGAPDEDGTYQDAAGAWQFLRKTKKIKPEHIIVFGRSLGGAIGAWICNKYQPAACIIESSFTSVRAIAGDLFPFLPTDLLCRYKYDTIKMVRQIKSPILIVHSPNDNIIPFSHGLRLFAAARQPKRFLKIQGSHNLAPDDFSKSYRQGLDRFLLMSTVPPEGRRTPHATSK